MPVIETKLIELFGKKWKQAKYRKMFVCECDQCGRKPFERFQVPDLFVYCSNKCASDAKKKGGKTYHQTCETNQVRYGVPFSAQAEVCKQRVKDTNIMKYGVESVLQLPQVHQRGLDAAQSPEAREKVRQTNLERHGVENAGQIPEAKEQRKQTCLERYGVEHHWMLDEVKEARRETWQTNLGVDNPFKSPEVQVSIAQTNLERYGAENPMQSPEIRSKAQRSHKRSSVITHWKTGEELVCTASYEVAFVSWCNANQVDFDWQIPFVTPLLTPKGRLAVYFVDAFIKSGEFAGTWVEVKGYMTDEGRRKWEWFHSEHPNDSQLWDRTKLLEHNVQVK